MQRILVILFIAATLVKPQHPGSNSLINTDVVKECQGIYYYFRQGTYNCVFWNHQILTFIYMENLMKFDIDVLSNCDNHHNFVEKTDTQKLKCVPKCIAPKIKNFVNGSCDTIENIQQQIPHLAVFALNQKSVFSLKQMRRLETSNLDLINQSCALIDLKNMTCLKSLKDCSGVIIDQIFCKQCNCLDQNDDNLICKQKCNCDLTYQQIDSVKIKNKLDENRINEDFLKNNFICSEECQNSSQVRYRNLCINIKKCPYVVEGNICLNDCGMQKRRNPKRNSFKKCTKCQRIERNQLCSDKCLDFKKILVYKSTTDKYQCEDMEQYPKLALFEGQGCSYPLFLSSDGSECLTECPDYQQHYHINETRFSKCVEECPQNLYVSSDKKHCLDSCSLLLEENYNEAKQCLKCKIGFSIKLQKDSDKTFCEENNSLDQYIFNFHQIIKRMEIQGSQYRFDLLDKETNRIFNLVRGLPNRQIIDRFEKYSKFIDYFKFAKPYHKKKQYQLISADFEYYLNISNDYGIGIESMNDKNQVKKYYSIDNQIKKVSLRFKNFPKQLSRNRIKQQILRFDNAEVCGSIQKCYQITIFFNIQKNVNLIPIFSVDNQVSQKMNKFYCVHEVFITLNNEEIYQLKINQAEKISQNEFECEQINQEGVGLIQLDPQDEKAFQQIQLQILK